MNNERLNRLVAELCGTLAGECPIHHSRECCGRTAPPDYTGSLDACAGFEAGLGEEQRHAYSVILSGMLWLPKDSRGWNDWRDTWAVATATAEERCLALVRTLAPEREGEVL